MKKFFVVEIESDGFYTNESMQTQIRRVLNNSVLITSLHPMRAVRVEYKKTFADALQESKRLPKS